MKLKKFNFIFIFMMSLFSLSAKAKEIGGLPGSPLFWRGNLYFEDISNLHGGLKRDSVVDAEGDIAVDYNTETANLWCGGLFTLGGFGAYSSNDPEKFTGSVQEVSSIQVSSVARLSYLMYEQKWAEEWVARLGLMDMENYFNLTTEAYQLLNDSFSDLPTLSMNANVASYPYSGLGVMGSYHSDLVNVMAGLFQGDPQHTSTVFHEGYMAIIEVAKPYQFKTSEEFKMTLKGGIWHYQQPNPAVGHTTNGLYAISEFHWNEACGREWGAFLQFGASPQKINTVPYYAGLGIRSQGFFSSRKKDGFTFGIARAWLQNVKPETVYEFVYLIQIMENVAIFPDIQYIVHPSGVHPNAFAGLVRLQIKLF